MPRRKPTGPRDRRDAPRDAVLRVANRVREAEYEQRQRAVCARKDRYVSESEARAFALMHQPGAGPRAAVYHCAVCGGWHHTSGR